MTVTTNEKSEISLFRKVYSRHKRRGKDPNRIDDLLGNDGKDTRFENGRGDFVIDIARIQQSRDRKKRLLSIRESLPKEESDNRGIGDTIDIDTSEAGWEDLLIPLTSVLPILRDDTIRLPDANSNHRRQARQCCPCFGFREFPGAYIYPRALDEKLHLRLAYEAVTKYCELGNPTAAVVTPIPIDAQRENETDDTARTAIGDGIDSITGSDRHRTNIDLLPPKPHERVNELHNENETMWNLWKRDQPSTILRTGESLQQKENYKECTNAQSNGDDGDASNRPPPEKKPRCDSHAKKKTRNKPNHKNHDRGGNNYYRRFSKLSWATMGYHYDWTERSYHPRKQSRMPDLVAKLSTFFATARPAAAEPALVDGNDDHHGDGLPSATFTPSASIVNYYTTKSTMGGHRDDLEDPDAMDKPIVSMSVGLPGIFVLGGPTRDERDVEAGSDAPRPHPVRALLLRPGDVLVMGGASRLNYHAMARVLPHVAALEYDRRIGIRSTKANSGEAVAVNNTSGEDPSHASAGLPSTDLSLGDDCDELRYLEEYLRNHRININVRQVYPD